MRPLGLFLIVVGGTAAAADDKLSTPDGRVRAYVEERGGEQVIRAPDGKILGYADDRRVSAPDGTTLYYLDDGDRRREPQPPAPRR